MRLSLMVLYVPPPSLVRAAQFYGALLDAEPVREQHGSGPEHYSITCPETGLTIEVYPAVRRPVTATRLEFRGPNIRDAIQRLMDRAYALPEPHASGGWWCTDPTGNTVLLLGVDAEASTANRRRAGEITGRSFPVSDHEAGLYRAQGLEPPAE